MAQLKIKTATFNRIYAAFGFALMALFLPACTAEKTPTAALKALEEDKPTKALSILKTQLAATPENLALNTLATRAALEVCAQSNCFTTHNTATPDALLADLTRYATRATKPAKLEKQALDLRTTTAKTAPQIMAAQNQPATILAAIQFTPEYARAPYITALADAVKTALKTADKATALTLLFPITRDDAFPKSTRNLAAYMHGLLNKKETFATANMVALKANKGAGIPPALWGALPYTWSLLNPTPQTFFKTYDAEMASLAKLANPASRAAIANSLADIASKNPSQKIQFTTRQLALNPEDTAAWGTYLPNLKTYLINTADTNLLTKIDPLNIPADVRVAYNTTLFELAEPFTAQNREPLALLQQVALQEMPKPSQVRLEKLVKAGLENALNRQKMDTVLAYAAFRPSVAQNSRRLIVPVVVDEIKAEFNANNFNKVITYGDFLKKDLGVNFDLDALLLQTYNTHLKTTKVADKLSADNPEWLLRDEPFNLGAKFAFLQTRFAEKPLITDNILKDIVSSASNIYGTPTAFYRLMHLFNDTTFPPTERSQYLRAAIKNSLEKDKDLSALATAGIGYRLHKKHQLNLNFIATESLARTDDLTEERKLWQGAETDLRATWQTAQPAYFMLMQAIDAFDNNNKAEAANLFNQITSSYYLKQAEPYFAHYAKTVNNALGWYVPVNILQTPIAYISVHTANINQRGSLTELDVSLINRVGSTRHNNPETLVSNHAAVYRSTLPGALDFNQNQITLDSSDKQQVILPEPFESIFGDVTRLKQGISKNGTQLLKVYTEEGGSTPQTFIRVSALSTLPLFPTGSYEVEQLISPSDVNTDGILAPKTIFSIAVDAADPITLASQGQAIGNGPIYPISGKMTHPSGTQPLKITGFFTPEKNLINLSFNYPLANENRFVKAAARCQQLGKKLICAAHNAHSNRQQYTSHTTGTMTTWEAWQKAQTARVNTFKTREQERQTIAAEKAAETSHTIPESISTTTAVSATQP